MKPCQGAFSVTFENTSSPYKTQNAQMNREIIRENKIVKYIISSLIKTWKGSLIIRTTRYAALASVVCYSHTKIN